MKHIRHAKAAIILLASVFTSACNQPPNCGNVPSPGGQGAATKETDKTWAPKWDTAAEKTKVEKRALTPTVAFVEDGFRGSPVPNTDDERKQASKNRAAFIKTFLTQRTCEGLTLKRTNPKEADFGIQVFHGIDGRAGEWEWVLYRMDTMGEKSHGQSNGLSPEGMLDDICSDIRNSTLTHGGTVE